MKLALTLEADSINVQALNMGRIVVDVDGVTLAELITWSAITVTPFVLLMNLTGHQQSARHHLRPLPAYAAVPHISRKRTMPGCSRCHIRRMTPANQNGFISLVADICYVPMRGHTRFCGLSAWACQKRSVVWLSHSPGVMASVSFIWTPAQNVCRGSPLSTGNQDKRHWMKLLTTETALDILIAWLQDNIDCESEIIFDNDEDKTDSAALLPCIEQAREDIRTLRQLQFQHLNR